MSKAAKITYTQRLRILFEKFSTAAQVNPGHIPAVCLLPSIVTLSIPSLPAIQPCIAFPDPGNHAHNPKKAIRQGKQRVQKVLAEQSTVGRNDLHLGIVHVLDDIGYSIDEVKALPSGEQKITVSDLLGNAKKSPEYEYAKRR